MPTILSDCITDQKMSFMPSIHNLWLLTDWHARHLKPPSFITRSEFFWIYSEERGSRTIFSVWSVRSEHRQWQGFDWQASEGKLPSSHQKVHSPCIVVTWREWLTRTEVPWSQPCSNVSCIPSPGTSIWSPFYQGASARHFPSTSTETSLSGTVVEAVLPFDT